MTSGPMLAKRDVGHYAPMRKLVVAAPGDEDSSLMHTEGLWRWRAKEMQRNPRGKPATIQKEGELLLTVTSQALSILPKKE